MMRLVDLWRRDGVIDRAPYALVGVIGFAIKHNIDRLVARLYHRSWSLASYWIPLRRPGSVLSLSRADAPFLLSLLLVALPFIWIGVCLTLKRLRSAALPSPLVSLFFVPYLNLVLFAFLSLVPSRRPAGPGVPATRRPLAPSWFRWFPEGRLASAAMALTISVLAGLAATLVSASGLALYSWGLFVGTPFFMGMIAVLAHGLRRPRDLGDSVLLALLAPILLGLGLLALDVEGAVCLLMAAPLGCALSFMGGMIGHGIQEERWSRTGIQALLVLAIVSLPVMLGADYGSRPGPPVLLVTTTVEIDAPPERVWRTVVSFPEIPEPREWLFRAGVAYPVRATIDGRGPGAVRHCVFSTGEFIEPIEVWDEPRLLRFSVRSNPPPMVEWTPYPSIRAPHLQGYFVAREGQFLLEPLPGGRTRVVASTWYRHAIWPTAYWRLWSDEIVHRIHLRVLQHIRSLAEGAASDGAL